MCGRYNIAPDHWAWMRFANGLIEPIGVDVWPSLRLSHHWAGVAGFGLAKALLFTHRK